MSITSAPRAVLIAALSLFAATVLLGWLQDEAEADDPVTEITAAPPLHWGFKATWRNYAWEPQVSDGAQVVASGGAPPFELEWAFGSGSYDPATRTTQLAYEGTAHWEKYRASELGWTKPPGYTGPETDPCILDVTISDPQITISRDSSVLTAVATSRDQATWELRSYGRVPIVNLDALAVTPATGGGITEWSGLTATVTAEGHPAFGGFYRPGQIVDPVSFSYTGPGGAPDFSEHWDTPGDAKLKLVENALFINSATSVNLQQLWIDRKNMVAHTARETLVGGVPSRLIEAFDLKTMQAVGEPLILPSSQAPQPSTNVVGLDTVGQRLIFRRGGEQGMPRWLRFNLVTKEYELDEFEDPQTKLAAFVGPTLPRMSWDHTRDRGFRVVRMVPPGVDEGAYDEHQWTLLTFEEGEDEIWVKKEFPLPSFPAGENLTGYSPTLFAKPTYAVASDGSLIGLANYREALAETAQMPGAYRFTFNEADDAVEVEPLPLDIYNKLGDGGVFESVQASANGHIVLTRSNGDVVHCRIGSAEEIECDEPASLSANLEPAPYEWQSYALDPTDGTVWFGGRTSQAFLAIRDGRFRGSQYFKERNPRGGPVVLGDDGYIYAQTNDGSSAELGGSKTWGYGKFERLGFVPEVITEPEDETAALGLGETSEAVSFSSTASGEPAPTRQWQAKAPGALKFADVEDETGATLSVQATRNDGGTQYRAIYSNAAGEIASEPATLSVEYAPAVLQDPLDVTAVEGDAAEFVLLSDGAPAPAVTWQRRVGGYWQGIDPGDDNFAIEGNHLTVLETNVEQSGSRFRATLANAHGNVKSKEARLTVEPRVSIPAEGIDLDRVELEWSGNEELQKAPPFGDSNYFSAGPSDGDEASYRAVDGNAAIFRLSPGGDETLPTWATRNDHLGDNSQVARLYGGEGRIEPDGSATVSWDGAFSVNFYGGLVPFTIADPVLEVDADGDGMLSADLAGFASSQANPKERTPLDPVADVTVATFSGVEVDPAGEVTIAPDYAGVEVNVPVPFAAQDRVASGWGAWPQPFVDFHGNTGLASYWYSSGGSFDPYKPPAPFTVDFEGGEPPLGGSGSGGGAGSGVGSPQGGGSDPAKPPVVTPQPELLAAEAVRLRRNGVAILLRATCPGPGFCALTVPRAVRVKLDGEVHRARVIAPAIVSEGELAKVKVRLPKALLRKLDGRSVKLRLRAVVRSQEEVVRQVAVFELGR